MQKNRRKSEYFTFADILTLLFQLQPQIVKTAKLSASKSFWYFIIQLFSKQDAKIT